MDAKPAADELPMLALRRESRKQARKIMESHVNAAPVGKSNGHELAGKRQCVNAKVAHGFRYPKVRYHAWRNSFRWASVMRRMSLHS